MDRNASCSTAVYTIYIRIHISSHLFFALLFSLLVVTQIRGHIAGSSPPLPTTVRALHFYREKISALSSLVDSRRIVTIPGIYEVHINMEIYLEYNSCGTY